MSRTPSPLLGPLCLAAHAAMFDFITRVCLGAGAAGRPQGGSQGGAEQESSNGGWFCQMRSAVACMHSDTSCPASA